MKWYVLALIIFLVFFITIIVYILSYLFTKTSLQANFTNNEKIKIEYYSLSTCPHCVEFNPIWDKFSKENKNTVKYVIDKNDVNDKLEKYDIHGFPTVIVIKNGKKIDELEERSYEGLKELYKKNE
jgi:thiol-disulfide isomerase/thioredoxin